MTFSVFPGNELRERREAMGLTPYEVFRKTHVPEYCVAAFEDGELHRLPAGCYAFGFLRTYCQFLELKPDRYLDSLRDAMRPSASGFLDRARAVRKRPPAWLGNAAAWAAIIGIVLLGWIAYEVVIRPDQAPIQAETVEMVLPPAPDGL